jgi:hypothetical protein
MTKQEMFDRAWNGLKGQGFTQCHSDRIPALKGRMDVPGCLYDDGEGHRCAWGWVDPDGTSLATRGEYLSGGVDRLQRKGIGLAAHLSLKDLSFAQALQAAHDNCYTPEDTEQALRRVAKEWGLTVPGEGLEGDTTCASE